tara:strand:- start:97647 stop:97919 length:273 start_codon:yes stop_codon:yes gene_type:complete
MTAINVDGVLRNFYCDILPAVCNHGFSYSCMSLRNRSISAIQIATPNLLVAFDAADPIDLFHSALSVVCPHWWFHYDLSRGANVCQFHGG